MSRSRIGTSGWATRRVTRRVHFLSMTFDDRQIELVNVHLTHRFPLSMTQLRRAVRNLDRHRCPRVLAGDTNLPRAAATALSALRPAVRGRTFPAERPLIQPDHILVSGHWTVVDSAVVRGLGSDHDAVVATLRLSEPRDHRSSISESRP